MKNIIKLRKITNIFYFIVLILSLFALFSFDDKNITIFGIDFCYNKINGMLLFLSDLTLYLFSLNSKNSIKNIQKIFYPLSIALLVLLNSILIIDNIFVNYILLFLIFLINYFLSKSKCQFCIDCSMLFASFVFISYGLLRYFAVNNIDATLSNIGYYQNRIDDFVIGLAFIGFLIIIFRLFNLIPFNLKQKNSHIFGFNTILYLIIGCDLLIKTFIIFNYFFYQFQTIIALYLIINVIYFGLIQFKSKGIIEFLKLTLPINIIVGIFSLFLYNEGGFISFVYYSMALILTYGAGFLISDIIEKKMGTNHFAGLSKISHNSRLIRFFIFIVFLNIAKIPPFIDSFASMYSFLNIFLIDFSGIVMTVAPYILFAFSFLVSLNTFGVLYKILIEPEREAKSFLLSQRQKFVLLVICFAIFITGAGVEYILNQFANIVDVGNM